MGSGEFLGGDDAWKQSLINIFCDKYNDVYDFLEKYPEYKEVLRELVGCQEWPSTAGDFEEYIEGA